MQLTELRIHNFRCMESAQLEPGPGLNLIVGENGSGKSSLLEAIYFLARADSFRHGTRARLVRDGAEQLTVFGRLTDDGGTPTSAGVSYTDQTARIKLGTTEGATVLDLVRALPIQLIDPRLQQLLEEGPMWRRRFLDWGVFHVEQSFYEAWRRYRRALLQRNQALRQGLPDGAVNAWNPELAAAGGEVDVCRRRHAERLREQVVALLEPEVGAVEVQYHAGWAQGVELGQAIAAHIARDRDAGHTGVGPHRADLRIKLQGVPVPERASRGEQKLVTAALLLAQAREVQSATARRPIFLIDDLAAELGPQYREWLLRHIEQLGMQAFLTFLQERDIPHRGPEQSMFHVEHGQVRRAS